MKKSFLCISLIVLSACASKDAEKPVTYKEKSPRITTTNPKPAPDVTAKMLGSEMGTEHVVEISFEKGSSQIDQKARKKLDKLLSLSKDKNVSEVQAITWADMEYPSKKKEELSKDQKELANKRNDALKSYFANKLKDHDFTSVSMAERPSFWGRVTASENSKIKKSLQLLEIATTADKSRGVSNVSKSIVLLYYSE